VSNCCARGYERFFGERTARRDARRYRRKGLDSTAQSMVDELARRGVAGTSVLEVGGGVGGIELELLKRGAVTATNVELSHGYDDEAARLAAEAGVEERVEQRHGDFVELEASIGRADVVVMHRVVCCYPDPDVLVRAAAAHAQRLLALSYPRDRWWTRAGARVMNAVLRMVWGFESFIHPPAAILGAAQAQGLDPVHQGTGWLWATAVLERR
jgi:magnesium-protoporphyrin O-methyltransferase